MLPALFEDLFMTVGAEVELAPAMTLERIAGRAAAM